MKIYGVTDGKVTKNIKASGKLVEKYGSNAVYIPDDESAEDFKEHHITIDDTFVFPDKTTTKVRLFIWTDSNGIKQGLCIDMINDTDQMMCLMDLYKGFFEDEEMQ